MSIWITSDPHYGHKNIVRGVSNWDNKDCCRNFESIQEMNDTIVSNINSCVKKEDTLYCLGDWNFGSVQNTNEFRDRINCENIVLILGNHDYKHGSVVNPLIKNWYWVREHRNPGHGFPIETFGKWKKEFSKEEKRCSEDCIAIHFDDLFEEVCSYKEIFYEKTRICMFHYPLSSWNAMSTGSIHLYGHCHRSMKDKFINGGKSIDVGLDGNNMMPYHINEIMELMKDLPIKKEGHHN